MYKHILIPTDGTPVAEKAVDAGIEFAREAGARVTLFTAVPEYRLPSEGALMARQRFVSPQEHERISRQSAGTILAPAMEKARSAGVDAKADHALSDHPSRAIIEAARRNGCDAIFMSSHGRKGISALLHGSQTADVLTHSDIPTLVYH